LAREGFGCTSYQICSAALVFAESRTLKSPWEYKMMPLNTYSLLLKAEYVFYLETPEEISKVSAEEMNRNILEQYFDLLKEITKALDIYENSQKLFYMDTTPLSANNCPETYCFSWCVYSLNGHFR
jgi:hypothetical protein